MPATIITQLAAFRPEFFILEVHIPVMLGQGFGVKTREGTLPALARLEPGPAASFALLPQEDL